MMKLLSKRSDGTFVAEVDGLPYHITQDDKLYQEAEALAEAEGVPDDPDPDQRSDAEKANDRLLMIKAECKRRIYAEASAEAQINFAAAVATISASVPEERTAEEVEIITGAQAAMGWVQAMRSQVHVLAADPESDYHADAEWPDVPAAAKEMIKQF